MTKYIHNTNRLDSLIHTNSEELAKSLPVISYPAKKKKKKDTSAPDKTAGCKFFHVLFQKCKKSVAV